MEETLLKRHCIKGTSFVSSLPNLNRNKYFLGIWASRCCVCACNKLILSLELSPSCLLPSLILSFYYCPNYNFSLSISLPIIQLAVSLCWESRLCSHIYFNLFFFFVVPSSTWDLSSLTWDQTLENCTGNIESLNHWTAREVPILTLKSNS